MNFLWHWVAKVVLRGFGLRLAFGRAIEED
jgi:hypothetical protein